MALLVTNAPRLCAIVVLFAIASGCFGREQAKTAPQSANKSTLPEVYDRLVSKVRQASSAEQLLTSVSDDIDAEALLALKKEIESDSRTKKSIQAQCGTIDILSCYQQAPTEETFLKHVDEGDLTMACLQYKGQSSGDYLVANVYFVFKKKWGFLGVSKKYIEIKRGQLVDTFDCWNSNP